MKYGTNNVTKMLQHVHTQYSMRDAVETPSAIIKRAKELDYDAISIVDHGNLHCAYNALSAGLDKDGNQIIKVIIGVEAYILPDESMAETRIKHHLVLLAKNLNGYMAIANAVTDSQLYRDRDAFPRMTYEILNRYFGPGSLGHGNVIATSACMNGEISSILLAKHNAQSKIERLKSKYSNALAKLPFTVQQRDEAKSKMEEQAALLRALTDEHKALSIVAKKPYAKRAKDIERRKERGEDVSKEEAALAAEMAESEAAIQRLPELKEEISKVKEALKKVTAEFTEIAKAFAPCERIEREIADAYTELDAIDESSLFDEAVEKALFYENIFGKGNYFIELHRHHIPEEEVLLPLLRKISEKTGIKTVGANDVHYCTKADARRRNLVAALRFNNFIEDLEKAGYDELYIKSYDEMCELFGEEQCMINAGEIADMCEYIKFPKGFHMPQFTPPNGLTAIQYLEKLARDGIKDRLPAWPEEYEKRLRHELDVIDKSGFATYLCVVQDFLKVARERGLKVFGPPALVVGPGRGSAVGSIVCYLTGITALDPIRYGLLFERFLNPERVSMPDIDTDYHPDIREDVIQYAKEKYGEDAVCSIYTKSRQKARAVIRNVGRVTRVPLPLCDRVAKMVPLKIGTLREAIAEGKTLGALFNGEPVDGFTREERKQVQQLLKDSLSVEGIIIGSGVHAAGVIIADQPVRNYIPLLWNEKKQLWVAQFDMNECEKNAGLLKMDFLGLINLAIITETLLNIQKNHGKVIDITKIDLNDQNVLELFRKGQTNCVFQFESSGMKEMLRQFKPTSFEDLILLNAAYRPGPMQYIPEIIDVKNGRKKPRYIVKGMESILGKTYGKPIYQEQVMQIFNKFAGFSLGQADIIRRIMSKKRPEEFEVYHEPFIKGMKESGATLKDAEQLWQELSDFCQYAFNKSHAAAYATLSMYTAWLKYYYPTEYMAAVLSKTNSKKLPAYIQECKALGVKVSPPDINRSGENFTPVLGREILFGLGSVKNVASAAEDIIKERDANGTFTIKDFVSRIGTSMNIKVLESLIKAGAFDTLQPHRQALLEYIPSLIDEYKAYIKLCQGVAEYNQKIKDSATPVKKQTLTALARKEQSAQMRLENFRNMICNILIQDLSQDEKLQSEYELLRYYASGHPLDSYRRVMEASRSHEIVDIDDNMEVRLAGRIKEIQMLKTKLRNEDMAKAIFEDLTGEIEVVIFPKTYAKVKRLLVEGAVLVLTGQAKVEADINETDDEDYTVDIVNKELIVNDVKALRSESGKLVIGVPDVVTWHTTVRPQVERLLRGDFEIFIHVEMNGEMRRTSLTVANYDELKSTLDRLGIEKLQRIA